MKKNLFKKKIRNGWRMICLISFLAISTNIFAQNKVITGNIVDTFGDPVIGASIAVKGTTNGTSTDFDGNFSLNGVDENAVIQASYIGYKTQEVSIKGKSVLNITLEEDTEMLEEVVVVGYGVQKKSDITGSLSRVTEKQIKERPVQNALQAMQGKAPGVDITSNNRPGELGEIRIRGNRSINATNDPLYVIDGIPLTAGSVADVNPNDIESMEILKDASATAIYGSRGANGVILISTKRGKFGKASINYDGAFGLSKINSMTDWMSAGEYLDWRRNAAITGSTYNGAYGTAPDPSRDRSAFFGTDAYMDRIVRSAYQLNADGTPVMRAATEAEKAMGYADQVPVYNSGNLYDQNWTDLVTRTGITNNHQISLTAGTESSSLYMSLAYLNQESPMKDQDYERYTININGEISPRKWLKVGMGINANHSIKNYGIVSNFANSVAKDSYGLALGMEPYAPAYDEDGKILDPRIGLSWHNLLLNIDEATNETRYYSAMMSSFTEITFTSWLKWRTNFGAQYRNSREGSYYGENFTNPLGFTSTEPNVAYNNHNQRISWTLENLLYFNKNINNMHDINVTLMQSAEMFRSEGLNVRAYEVTYPTSLWYNIAESNRSKIAPGSSFNKQQRASYMARINYGFMNRYLLTLTGRYDGASMLATGNKWDFFPSAALAWKMEEEDFIKTTPWINQLKLRVGYGVTGNASVNSYSTTGSILAGNIPFGQGDITGNIAGAKAEVMPNYALGWEKTASTNIGVDFSFLKGRISGSAEYYIANTYDLLMSRTLPPITGYVSLQDNVGKTRNKGFELTLSTINVKTKDFMWQTDFTFSRNKEEIVELANGKIDDKTNKWFIGKPIDEVWTYKFDRIWSTGEKDRELMEIYKANKLIFAPGQGMIVDQEYIPVPEGTEGSKTVSLTMEDGTTKTWTYMDNGFGVINDDDKQFLGSFQPKWVGGFNTHFTYKNWQLSAFLYARVGNLYYGLVQTYGRRKETDIWSETNQNAKYPQPSTQAGITNYNAYQGYTKGSMGVVRNISLQYTVPNSFLNKLSLSNAQVYVQILNPFIFGGELVKAGINPDDPTGWNTSTSDTNYIGGQTNNTAITRSYVLGLRLGF